MSGDILKQIFNRPDADRRSLLEQELHNIIEVPFDLREPAGTLGTSSALQNRPTPPEIPVPQPNPQTDTDYFSQNSTPVGEEEDYFNRNSTPVGGDGILENLTDPQQYTEVAKGIPSGAVRLGGTVLKGAAAANPLELMATDVDRYRDRLAHVPKMSGDQIKALVKQMRKDETRTTMRTLLPVIRDLSNPNVPLEDRQKILAERYAPATPLQDRTFYKAGEDVGEFAKSILPAEPGYEDATGRQLGEGLGSLLAGIPAALIGGPVGGGVFFGAAGIGEAGERAVEYDRKEKKEGRSGLTEEQINTAALAGIAPGTTDIIPVETLLGRIPLPVPPALKKPLAQAIGRIGGQAFIEGLQESGQAFLQNLIQREVYDETQSVTEGTLAEGALGAGVGGIAQTGVELGKGVLGRRSRGRTTREEAREAPTVAPEEDIGAPPVAENQPPAPEVELPEVAPAAQDIPPEIRAVLRKQGYSTQDIETMSLDEIVSEAEDAVSQGVEVTQEDVARETEISAEPQGDLYSEGSREVGAKDAPVVAETAADVDIANARVDTEPTEAQKEAGNYRKGHLKLHDLDITIENPKGSTRSGRDPSGEEWSVELPATYGYIKRTEGADGDQLDVYIGDEPESDRAFVVDQINPETGKFDEHKAVLGVRTLEEAQDLYEAGFSDGSGTRRFGGITEFSTAEFKDFARSGNTKNPLAFREPADDGFDAAFDAGLDEAFSNRPAPEAERDPVKFVNARRAGVRKTPLGLTEFLARNGGIRDDGGELAALDLSNKFVPGAGKLVRKGGLSADEARALAVEHGYIGAQDRANPDRQATTTPADLYEALDAESRGEGMFSADDRDRVEEIGGKASEDAIKDEAEARFGSLEEAQAQGALPEALQEFLAEHGMQTSDFDAEVLARAQPMVDEGMDAGDALERASIEVEESDGLAQDIPVDVVSPDEVNDETVERTPSEPGTPAATDEPAGERPEEVQETSGTEPEPEQPVEARPERGAEGDREDVRTDPEATDFAASLRAVIGTGGGRIESMQKVIDSDPSDTQIIKEFEKTGRSHSGVTLERGSIQARGRSVTILHAGDDGNPTRSTIANKKLAGLIRKAFPSQPGKESKTSTVTKPEKVGADHLANPGEAPITGYEGEDARKKEFLSNARSYLTKTAKMLSEDGFVPHLDPKGKKMKPVSVNKAGPAVAGEVSLILDHPDGTGVYVQIGHGVMGPGLFVMARSTTSKDRFGTKSQNNFLPANLSIQDLADHLKTFAGRGETVEGVPVETRKGDRLADFLDKKDADLLVTILDGDWTAASDMLGSIDNELRNIVAYKRRRGESDQADRAITEGVGVAEGILDAARTTSFADLQPPSRDEDTGEFDYDTGHPAMAETQEWLDILPAQGFPVDQITGEPRGPRNDASEPMDDADVFPPPAKTESVTNKQKNGPFISQDNADALKEEWKQVASRVGEMNDNGNKVIFSLFDYTGEWSKPWAEAGFNVVTHDIKAGEDLVTNDWIWDRINEVREEGYEVYGVLSACPCTTFSGSGARWWRDRHDKPDAAMLEKVFGEKAPSSGAKSPVEYNVMLVDATREFIKQANPTAFHVLENPIGRIQSAAAMPRPAMRFDPNNYGDPYTKKTNLFGVMNTDLPSANVEPTEGSKVQSKLRGDRPADKEARSTTPEGFSYAFFMANAPQVQIAAAIDSREELAETSEESTKTEPFDSQVAPEPKAGDAAMVKPDEEGLPDLPAFLDRKKTPRETVPVKQASTEPELKTVAQETDEARERFDAYLAARKAIKGVSLVLNLGKGAAEALQSKAVEDGRLIKTKKGYRYKPKGYDERIAKLQASAAARRAEKAEKLPPPEPEEDGQTVIPGAEKIGDKKLAERKANEKLKPAKEQKDADFGLFGSDRDQLDLLAQPAPESEFDTAFDEGLDEAFAPEAPAPLPPSKTKTEVAQSAAENLAESAEAAMAGLVELFGGGKTIGSGPAFDPDTYERAKPLFIQAATKFVDFKNDVGELVRRMVVDMVQAHGLTREGMEAMRPYLRRFVGDVESGIIDLSTTEDQDDAERQNIRDDAPVVSGEEPSDRAAGAGTEPGTDPIPEGSGSAGRGYVRGASGEDDRGEQGNRLPPSGGGDVSDTSGRGGTSAERSDLQRDVDETLKNRSQLNYRITAEDKIGEGGPKAKVRANIEAIRTLKLIEDEGRTATPDEQAILVKYVGWGAFAQDVFATHKPDWKKERAQLNDLLSAEEIASARASTLNAHYTSREVIEGIWDAVQHLGFTGGRALEPSAGVGHFIGLTPNRIAADTSWSAVELDSVTGRIAKHLYQSADVNVQGFETFNRPADFYDLAISNVPFGAYKLPDRKYPPALIHDYFFMKSLDKVRPGGIVAFVTSSGTLDKKDQSARKAIAKRGDFLGAIRLPGGKKGAFAGNASTDVTTDIIFMRASVPGSKHKPDHRWLDTVEIKTPEGPATINRYFANEPHMMLGKMRLTGTQYTANQPVLVGSVTDIRQKIATAAANLPNDAFLPRNSALNDVIADDTFVEAGETKEGAFFEENGKLYRKVFGIGQEQKASKIDRDRIARLVKVRNVMNELLAKQAVGDRVGVEDLRTRLTQTYDAFVKKHGPVSHTKVTESKRLDSRGQPIVTRRMPNFSAFKADPDAYKVLALENYDIESDTATKAAIFTEDIVSPVPTPEIETEVDALSVSLNWHGKVSIPFIAQSLNISNAQAVERLGDRIFLDPEGDKWTTAEQYLSGDVVSKLEDARAAVEADPHAYTRNVEALKAVQPDPLTRADIRVPFGGPWVPADVFEQFLSDEAEATGALKLSLNPATKRWRVVAGGFGLAGQSKYGHGRMTVADLVENALNMTPITITTKTRDGVVVDHDATQEVRSRAAALREAFGGDPELGTDGWIWRDEDRATRLEEIYNRTYNRLVSTKYDGSHLTFPGLAKTLTLSDGTKVPFSLRKHQKDAVWRTIQSGNTLFDHVVGAGKTFTMIASGMEQKRLGLIQRPVYVVPNHMLEQFSREFLQAYPSASIMVADKDSMSLAKRKEMAARVAAQKWDGIIITHDAFGRLRMSPDAYTDYVKEEIRQLEEMKEAAAAEEGKASPTIKDMERAKKTLEARLDKLVNTERKDTGVTFEELGIDMIFLDEAHLFKNLSFATRHTRVKGVGQGDAQRATDLFLKIRHLESQRPGRSSVFATGTPLSNTMAEIYTMQRYQQFERLKEYGIEQFDAWAGTFGEIVSQMELAPDGRSFRETSSFSKFINIPELIAIYSEFADTQTAEMLNLPRPKLKGGAPIIVEAEPSPYEEAIIASLVKRAQGPFGRQEKGADNMLKVVTEGRKVAIDARLLNPDAPFNPNGTAAKAVQNIYRIWKTQKAPALVQMVFLDMGVPTSRSRKKKVSEELSLGPDESDVIAIRFNLYEDIRTRLVEAGIPRNHVAFIHEATDDAKKALMFQKARSGEIRVLIGSTSKMGMGTNVQDRLYAMHHLDAPWKPAEVEQRDGRIIRQGNLNDEVEMYRYLTKRSFSAFMWQTLERKSKFIGQIKAGARGVRSAEDIDDPLPEAAQLKAAASGDPRIMEHAELTKEVRDLDVAKRAHERTSVSAKRQLKEVRSEIEYRRGRDAEQGPDLDRVTDVSGESFTVTMDVPNKGKAFKERKKAGTAIRDFLVQQSSSIWGNEPRKLEVGTMSGFRMGYMVQRTADGIQVAPFLGSDNNRYNSSAGWLFFTEDSDPVGLIRRFERTLMDIPRSIQENRDLIPALEREIAPLEKQATGSAFPKQAQLEKQALRLKALTAELTEKKKEDQKPDAEAQEGETPNLGSLQDAGQTQTYGRTMAQVDALESEVRDLADTILGHHLNRLEVATGTFGDERYSGFFNPAHRLLAVSLDAADPRATLRHEAIHALRHAGVFTEKEWTILARTANSRWLDEYNVERTYAHYPDQFPGLTPAEVEDLYREEAVAQAFQDFRDNVYQPGPLIRRLFDRVLRFLEAVANAMRSEGFQTFEDIFEAIDRGDLSQRAPDSGAPRASDLVKGAKLGSAKLVPPRKFGFVKDIDPPISSYEITAQMKDHPDYVAAKSGDEAAAVRLVRDVVQPATVVQARERFGADVTYVPVIAEEMTGDNAIPEAIAHYYAGLTGGTSEDRIIQTTRAFHTGANAIERLIARPEFGGPVETGQRYVIVDDATVMGGTLAELSNHIQANGGQVVGVVTLVNASRTANLSPRKDHLRKIEERYGDVIRTEFRIEPDALTAAEAQYIVNFRDADSLRARIAKGKEQRKERLLQKGVRGSDSGDESLDPNFSMTLRARRALGDIQSDVKEIVQRIAPNAELVMLADLDLPGFRDPTASRRSGGLGATPQGGVYVQRAGLEPVIFLALNDKRYDPRNEAGHEAWHSLELGNLLTGQEQAILLREQPRLRAIAAAELGLEPDSDRMRDVLDYEVNAIAFARYRRLIEDDMPLSGYHIGLRRIFGRMANMLRQVRNAVQGLGFTTTDDIFETARQGAIGSREPQARPTTSVTAHSMTELVTRDRAERTLARAGDLSDAVRIRVQDRFLPWKRLQEQLEAETGTKLHTSFDTYMAESLYHGRAGERMIDVQDKYLEPLIELLRGADMTIDQVGDYLYARHAKERNEHIAAINPSMPQGGSGMTDLEAAVILKEVADGDKQGEFDAAAKIIDDMLLQTRQTLLSAGLIDKATFDNWSTEYANYVPLRGFELSADEDPDRPRSGLGFDIRGPEAFQALGRRSKADNPIIFAAMQAQEAIVRAEKNRVLKTVMRSVQAHPIPSVWKIHKGTTQRRINPQTGLVETTFIPPGFAPAENLFRVKIGGHAKWIEIKHPALARALRGSGGIDMQGSILGRGMLKIARFYAGLVTQWSPEFIVSNYARDIETAIINSADVEGLPKGARLKIIKDAASLKSIRGIVSALRGTGESEYAPWFEEYRLAGGKISFIETNDVDRIRARIQSSLKAGRARRGLRDVAKLVEDLNSAVENGVRLSTYVSMRKAGISKDVAASAARELTVNFNRKGENGPALNAAFLFFNASVQGSTRMAQAFKRSKTVRLAVGGIFAAGMNMDILNYILAGDDDDGENAYDKIEDWKKERNIIIMIPGDPNHGYIMWPLAWGYNVPYLAGQQLMATIRGQRKPLEAAATISAATWDSFNPMGSAPSGWQFMSPTLLDPAVQVWENLTWYGGPIQPKKFDPRKPDSENFFASAPFWAVDLARTLNETTGGNVGRSGWFDISPETIEHYVEFIGGGVSKFVVNAMNTGERVITGEKWLPEKTPFLRRLYGKATATSRRREFYEAWDEVDGARYEIKQLQKAGDREAASQKRQEYRPELRAHKAMKNARKVLTSLRKRRNQIELDRSITDLQRRERLEDLVTRENGIILRAMATYNRAKKKNAKAAIANQ